ncbi:transglycosylase domain-containing protein, partial [Actinotalea sp. C106]|uniref:transglycosylase domain-containing protein n=1 Tax=Actinotalea sp. C106 TaxID=2908644 RepID=UPI002027B78D
GGSGGGRSGGGRSGGAAGAGKGSRRRLIDYPRAGKTGIRRWLPSWRLVLGVFLFLVLLVVGFVVWAYASTEVPQPDDFAEAQTTTVYYADGETEMGTFGVQNRVLVSGDQIPEHMRQAVVAAEDRTFYENPGINPAGLVRAVWNNVRGGDTQGGSSITQQYAERYYFGTTIDDYRGKAREALLAIKLARQQDKDEILENYLNTIYLGRDSYGIETAAQSYFGVGVADLTLAQSALIAGIVPSPNNWDPHVNPERAEERWNYVLDGMVETGAITQAERDAETYPIDQVVEYSRSDTMAGPQGYLLAMVESELTAESSISSDELRQRGFRITTTIDPSMQQAAVDSVAELPEDAPENLRTAMVTLDPQTGAIRALYGGPDYLEVSRNAVTQDEAQAGSTFKPFTLVAYLEAGNALTSRYDGNNRVRVEGFGEEGVRNFGDESFGNIDVVKATASSVNSVYAQMNVEVGPEATLEAAVRAGVPEDASGMDPVPANVLGTASPHPLDMAHGYNTFAAQGVRTEPYIVEMVEYLDGGQVYEGAELPERVFEEDVMADTTYALTQVVQRGSGTPAQALGRPVAGKTGTSNDNRSAWFVGYTPQLTTAVAMYQVSEDGTTAESITPFGGFSQITGGSVPVNLWTSYMSRAMDGMEVLQFPPRADVGEPNTPPLVAVPNVVGSHVDEARAALEGAGFAVAGTEVADDAAPGTVISQSPTGEAPYGSAISISVSTGPAAAEVPDVTGLPEADAVARLEGAGFSVSVSRQESGSVAEGRVISASPSGGEAAPGSTVSIVVSSGPPEVIEEPEPTEPTEAPEEPTPPDGDEGEDGTQDGAAPNPNP